MHLKSHISALKHCRKKFPISVSQNSQTTWLIVLNTLQQGKTLYATLIRQQLMLSRATTNLEMQFQDQIPKIQELVQFWQKNWRTNQLISRSDKCPTSDFENVRKNPGKFPCRQANSLQETWMKQSPSGGPQSCYYCIGWDLSHILRKRNWKELFVTLIP